MMEERIYGYTKAGVGITDPYFAELMKTDDFSRDRCLPAAEAGDDPPKQTRYERAYRKIRGAYPEGQYVKKKHPAYLEEVARSLRAKFGTKRGNQKPPKPKPSRAHPWSAVPLKGRAA